MCSEASDKGAAPLVVVALEPRLLADLLREVLNRHGVPVAAPDNPPAHADIALLNDSTTAAADADVVVRLTQSGQTMPTVVNVETGGVSRSVVLGNADELIDLLVDLTGI